MTMQLDSEYEKGRPAMTALRRDIHCHPELSFKEVRTAALVAEKLLELGLEVRTGVGKTGVTGLLKGGSPGKTLLIRADMDALPIEESNGLAFRSREPGVMHA